MLNYPTLGVKTLIANYINPLTALDVYIRPKTAVKGLTLNI